MFGKRKMKKQNRWISKGTRSRKIFKGIFVIYTIFFNLIFVIIVLVPKFFPRGKNIKYKCQTMFL